MTARTSRRWPVVLGLLAPLAAVPVLAWLLMEYGPERSFLSALYLLVWALAFLISGLVVLRRRPGAGAVEVLARAALWALAATVVVVGIFAAVVTMLLVRRTS